MSYPLADSSLQLNSSQNFATAKRRSNVRNNGRTVFFGGAEKKESFQAIVGRKAQKSKLMTKWASFSRAASSMSMSRMSDTASVASSDETPDINPNAKILGYNNFPSNKVSSAKYSVFNFLPLQLLYQFSKFANIYFLFISILQQIPGWSPTGQYTTVAPLFVFVSLAILREAYDDYKRHQQDNGENMSSSEILISHEEFAVMNSEHVLNRNVFKTLAHGIGRFNKRESQSTYAHALLKNAHSSDGTDKIRSSAWPFSLGRLTGRGLQPPEFGEKLEVPSFPTNIFSRRASIMKTYSWKHRRWQQLQIGDVVRVNDEEEFPADLLLLSSDRDDGICFVETKSLDGETSLKEKQSCKETSCWRERDILAMKACIHCESPNNRLYQFHGSLEYESDETGKSDKIPLGIRQLLLRGSRLRNTKYVYGVVVFTGEETKIRKNANTKGVSKSPAIERRINMVVVVIFTWVILLAAMSTLVALLYNQRYPESVKWYVNQSATGTPIGITGLFFTFVILYNTMIPISLYVTMEIVKLVQVYLISHDREMTDPETGLMAVANTSSLNEDLGQVDILFSDKTGTLTENVMKLRKVSIGGKVYSHIPDDVIADAAKSSADGSIVDNISDLSSRLEDNTKSMINLVHSSQLFQELEEIVEVEEEIEEESNQEEKAVNNDVEDLPNDVQDAGTAAEPVVKEKKTRIVRETIKKRVPIRNDVKFFVESMALCQTAVPSGKFSGESKTSINANSAYDASSPDESAIVQAAKEVGYAFSKRSPASINVVVKNPLEIESKAETKVYEILQIIEFNSDRKRMSVIYRYPNDEIFLLCKGADSEIFKRLEESEKSASLLETTQSHVRNFATEGLRTLVYAIKKMSSEEYENWAVRYNEATTSIENRQQKIDEVADEIERGLTLIGATAIEDKLQAGVPETLENLRKANIKLWVLTGDKRETAINIGYSSNLIKSDSVLHVLSWKDVSSELEFRRQLEKIDSLDPKRHNVLVLDGETLSKIEGQHNKYLSLKSGRLNCFKRKSLPKSLMDMLIEISRKCDTSICCRVSPIQKALIVRETKAKLPKGKVTLAIGDGANDIAMITEAHVGIGIAGREGIQAARASDYYIYRFRFLNRLLFVHGHWSYIRVSRFLLGSFYKCITFYTTQLLFQIFTQFTGTSLYESWTLAMYNVAFSSLPVIFIGIFEKDIDESILLANPSIYKLGQICDSFNFRVMLGWLLSAIYHSAALLFVPLSFMGVNGNMSSEYQDGSIYLLGTICYTSVVFVVNSKIALVESRNWAWPTLLILLLTIAFWFAYQIIYSMHWSGTSINYDNEGVFNYTSSKGNYYFIVILTISVALIPDFIFYSMRSFSLTLADNLDKMLTISRRSPDIERPIQKSAVINA